jgi:Ca2+-binding RTX toxin-like protein
MLEILGTTGDDTLTGGSTPDRILGLAGDDSLSGEGEDDYLSGGQGKDDLIGGPGDDVLNGGPDDDDMQGDAGDDLYIVNSAGDQIKGEAAGGGADTVVSTVSLTLIANVEDLILDGTTALNGTGNGLSNRITGNQAANTLDGGDGNDFLTGGLGKDTLFGGKGDDRFIYTDVLESPNTATGRDVIKDFNEKLNDEKIDLSLIDANEGTATLDAFTFVGLLTGGVQPGVGEVGYLQENPAGTANDKTIVLANTDSDTNADLAIELPGLHTLAGIDFIL